ncbi:MAG TPA: fumarylacetoacetate hydrolase family protein [Steroidobacteraceae bacterium]|nr:fumarylacetoacetate hydrolase family protein [Steroidobacteraceae bacterium]
MRLVSFLRNGLASFGCVEGDAVLDFGATAPANATLRDYLPLGLPVWKALAGAVGSRDRVPLSQVTLLAPVPNARKFLALGGNYAAHAAEAARAGIVRTNAQVWFNKQITCINGPYAPIERPRVSTQLDYEGELGVVIARSCRHVTSDAAWSVVAGYVVCNDVSVRDWQLRAPTHMLGKSFDTHGPFGPWIVTADEIPNPHALMLETFVNGELRQRASTADMIHHVPAMLEELTTAFTLQPGDILSTGTPAGVGGLLDPPRYLVPGDVVRVEIEGIGYIENRVVEERS